MPKTGFSNGFADVPTRKYYKYHGWVRSCNTEPVLPPYLEFPVEEGPHPIFKRELKITTLHQCGETHWPSNLFNPSDVITCDPNMVREDDGNYLYTKTRWWVGNGQALYNKESLLAKIYHKVIAIQSVEVYTKGEVFISVPGTHYNCGPGMGKIYAVCSQTEYGWQGVCCYPGGKEIISYKWTQCKPPLLAVRNWGMKVFEEDCKIGFGVDQCTEDDSADYGINRTRGYYNYCVVKFKYSTTITLEIQDPVWDVGSDYALVYGKVVSGGNGYLIRGFQVWKKISPGIITEQEKTGNISGDEVTYWEIFHGLVPDTEYEFRSFIRNTGSAADSIYGEKKEFKTKI